MTLKTTTLQHGRIALALHHLRESEHGWPLLLLHGLGERSPDAVGLDIAGWTGSVYALDFTGHGDSQNPAGGGYSAEILMADVDTALSNSDPAPFLGAGSGVTLPYLSRSAPSIGSRGHHR